VLAVADGPAPSGPALVERIAAAIRAEYAQLGIERDAAADPHSRFGATLALALAVPGGWRFYRIGDSGIRLDGTETLLEESALDPVYSLFRAAFWRRLAASGLPTDEVDHRARLRLVEGVRAATDDAELARAAREEATDEAVVRFPVLDAGEVRELLDRGLACQSDHRGGPGPLGYGSLDGWPIPERFIHVDDRPAETVRSIELFTDGYYGVAPGCTLAAWEHWIARVEREDPHRIGSFASTKGARPGHNADDRSLVIVHP
jgi:hypothetical protein